jgi:hypothetical protein
MFRQGVVVTFAAVDRPAGFSLSPIQPKGGREPMAGGFISTPGRVAMHLVSKRTNLLARSSRHF